MLERERDTVRLERDGGRRREGGGVERMSREIEDDNRGKQSQQNPLKRGRVV